MVFALTCCVVVSYLQMATYDRRMLVIATFLADFLSRYDMIKHSASPRQLRHELAARFEKIRGLLLTDRFAEQLHLPLTFWALPADRRLPRALMGRNLGDLLRTPFASLAATPGIGQKKIQSLLRLLDRALHTDDLRRERLEDVAPQAAASSAPRAPRRLPVGSDPSNISEVTWATWRSTITRHCLGHEPLGCFANELHELPRAIWNVPLDHYAERTLVEIRRLKTHGEKRVRSVVTIFGRLHSQLDGKPADSGVVVRLTPQSVDALDAWLDAELISPQPPRLDELRLRLVDPLVEQVARDAGAQTAEMLRGRLGLDGPALSVRKTAMRLHLTRARIYQLLEDAATVVDVRWPRGKSRIRALLNRYAGHPADSAENVLLRSVAETFFPTEFRPVPPPQQPFVRRVSPPSTFHAPAPWTSARFPSSAAAQGSYASAVVAGR